MADRLAKKAVKEGIDTQLQIPYKDFSSLWKLQMFKEFYDWRQKTSERKGKFYFDNFYQDGRNPWYKNLPINRKAVSSISSLRSGHTSLKASLFRFNITSDPYCSCGEEQTTDKILFQCIMLEEQRRKFMKILRAKWGFGPFSAKCVLRISEPVIINALASFINNIDIDI